jgi:hypothetical protein
MEKILKPIISVGYVTVLLSIVFCFDSNAGEFKEISNIDGSGKITISTLYNKAGEVIAKSVSVGKKRTYSTPSGKTLLVIQFDENGQAIKPLALCLDNKANIKFENNGNPIIIKDFDPEKMTERKYGKSSVTSTHSRCLNCLKHTGNQCNNIFP